MRRAHLEAWQEHGSQALLVPTRTSGGIERTRESMRAVGVDLLVLTEPEDIFYLTAHQTVGAPQVPGERFRAS